MIGIQADLSTLPAIPSVVEHVVECFGGIDILVTNAGIMHERSVSDIQAEEWDIMIALNLRAPLFLVQSALPYLRDRRAGSIINIGSVEGLAANPNHTAYCASKAGIHGMTRAMMAVDLGQDNVRCDTIAPGWIASELSETYLESQPDPAAARQALNLPHPPGVRRTAQSRRRFGRLPCQR